MLFDFDTHELLPGGGSRALRLVQRREQSVGCTVATGHCLHSADVSPGLGLSSTGRGNRIGVRIRANHEVPHRAGCITGPRRQTLLCPEAPRPGAAKHER
jgi:hypothetical protein